MKRRIAPLVVEFMPGSRIRAEAKLAKPGPILKVARIGGDDAEDEDFELENTLVLFPNGEHISLPTEQVVTREHRKTCARVGFGGMCFEGLESGRLVFWKVRDLLPDDRLPTSAQDKVTIEPTLVRSVIVDGAQVWPRGEAALEREESETP